MNTLADVDAEARSDGFIVGDSDLIGDSDFDVSRRLISDAKEMRSAELPEGGQAEGETYCRSTMRASR